MNRRFNSVALLAGATVLNLVLLMFYFLTLNGLAGLFLPSRTGWVAVGVWAVLFVAALGLTWFTYRWAFAVLKERIPFDRYFDSTLFKGLF